MDSYTNLCLAILNLARIDEAPMWQEFRKTSLYRAGIAGNVDSFGIALWVADYIG